MKRRLGSCFLLLAGMSAAPLFGQNVPPRAPAFASAPEIPYDSVPNFLKLPPGLYFGEGAGVASNSKGHIFVYTRGGDGSDLFEFDAKGAFVRQIGKGLYGFQYAHAVRVDPQDNIWIVDEGTDMVIKFGPDGHVAMTMGRRPELNGGLRATEPANTPPPPPEPYRFRRPTDVTFDRAGNIFVADGYGNQRVVKYDKTGRYLKEIGTAGSGPGQFNAVISVQTDAQGNLYVADRGNRRIQVFSNDLVFKASYDDIGGPWAICITPGPHQYLYSSNSNPAGNNSLVDAVSGEIYKMELDGTVIGKFGKPGKQLKGLTTVHAMDCRNENEILTAEVAGWRVQKLILHPRAQPSPK